MKQLSDERMKQLSDEQIRHLLTNRLDVRQRKDGSWFCIHCTDVIPGDAVPVPEFETMFPGPPIGMQVTLPFKRNHGRSGMKVSLLRFRWTYELTNGLRTIMPWDWEHTAWIPVHLFEIAVRSIIKRYFPDKDSGDVDVRSAVFRFGSGSDDEKPMPWILGDEHLGAGIVSIEDSQVVKFFFEYQRQEVRFEVPMFLILETVRGCLSEEEIDDNESAQIQCKGEK